MFLFYFAYILLLKCVHDLHFSISSPYEAGADDKAGIREGNILSSHSSSYLATVQDIISWSVLILSLVEVLGDFSFLSENEIVPQERHKITVNPPDINSSDCDDGSCGNDDSIIFRAKTDIINYFVSIN